MRWALLSKARGASSTIGSESMPKTNVPPLLARACADPATASARKAAMRQSAGPRRMPQPTETQTNPSPTAIPRGRAPTLIRTTPFFFGSTRTTERVLGSAIQTEPSPTAMADGYPPIGRVSLTEFVVGSMRVSVPVPTVSAGQQRKPGRATTQTASSPTASAVGTTTPSPIVFETALDSVLIRITPASVPTQRAPAPNAIPDEPGTPPTVPLLN